MGDVNLEIHTLAKQLEGLDEFGVLRLVKASLSLVKRLVLGHVN